MGEEDMSLGISKTWYEDVKDYSDDDEHIGNDVTCPHKIVLDGYC